MEKIDRDTVKFVKQFSKTKVDCPECKGSGIERCMCQCGNQHENVCPECKGLGFKEEGE